MKAVHVNWMPPYSEALKIFKPIQHCKERSALKGFLSKRPEVFLRKGGPKIYSKFAGEHPCQSVISTKLLGKFIEITLRHGYSPVKFAAYFQNIFS